ncbi:MAG: hypothetical protein ACKVOH_01670 [Chlamydiales bacterium]
MKKLALLAISLMTCGMVHALPVGNPAEPALYTDGIFWEGATACCDPCDPCASWCDWFSWRLGFYGDYVFNRHLETKATGAFAGEVERTTISTNAGLITVGICDTVDLFATVGVSNLQLITNDKIFLVFDDFGKNGDILFSPKFSWSVGARWAIISCGNFALGLEGQYFQFSPNMDRWLTQANDDQSFTYFNTNRGATYSEWQAGLGASYVIETCGGVNVVPYAAFQAAGAKLKWNTTHITINGIDDYNMRQLKESKTWGWALGSTIMFNDAFGLGVEGRWANEKAVYVNGQVRF